jgi:quinol monooxygenase YgiN
MPLAITVVATITALPNHHQAVEHALRSAVPRVVEEAGCEQYALHVDLAQPARFVLLERWRDAAALEQHAQAPVFQALASALDGVATLEIIKLHSLA